MDKVFLILSKAPLHPKAAKRGYVSGTVACLLASAALVALPTLAFAVDSDAMSTMTNTLRDIATIMGLLCIFAALIMYGANKFFPERGGAGEGAMVGLACAAAACFAASAFISNVDLSVSQP